MDRFGRKYTRGARGPKGDKGDDIVNLLPRSLIHLLKTIEYDLSCSLTEKDDLKINVHTKEIIYWYSKSNDKRKLAGRTPAPVRPENWIEEGIIFPPAKKSQLITHDVSLFSKHNGLIVITFRTTGSNEGVLCVSGSLMENKSYVRQIRVTDKSIIFVGQDSDLKPTRYKIETDTEDWTTLLVSWSHDGDSDVSDFTVFVNDEIHYFSFKSFQLHTNNILIGGYDDDYYYGHLKRFEIWHCKENIPRKLIDNILVHNA